MKQPLLFTLLAAFLLCAALPAQAAEAFWYEVILQKGNEVQTYAGSASVSPEQFAKRVKEGEVIELDDLREFTNRGGGGAQRWQAAAKAATETRTSKVYLNPHYIISFRQFSKDPAATEEKKP
jgi:hypothetical protein